ncbi:oxysterol-binding protein-related protein 9-like isoform X2 [Physella acuta]|uniref:oxysterol-binding protein-related protein 9-like isoform X2 n=1 Tax=Physella acuta TaxID=109671 RepID=UPI0027DE964F|nr:oxysterol-binding protein-related protein 9-like isoform X2 [Physella acuta]
MAIKMEGPLSKWTNVMKGWQYRWFVLDDSSGILSYYTSKEKMVKGSRRGCVRLKGAIIGIDDEDDSTFTITVDHKTFHFQARDEDERERWIEALESAICHISGQRTADGQPSSTLEDFEKKLMETDAYLQLLIEQNEALEKKILECPNESDKERYNVIKVTADAMIEAIKHSIVQLQIAKENLKEPVVNGALHDPPLITDDANYGHYSPTPRQVMPSLSSENVSQACKTAHPQLSAQTSISLPNLACTDDTLTVTVGESIPVTSYSSSEDEEFYDAEEQKSPKKPDPQARYSSCVDPESLVQVPVISAAEDYFDELYDTRDNEDLGSMEQHGSIIGHLLSQVRIGMDLTKVVLPTFILERRSLLEMFADFFAHPDAFSKIADLTNPKDRMVQVVQWYMGAFHAGRPSEIAKKPYNPILGETFKCHWHVPDIVDEKDPASDGPIPWASKDNLVFIAEQVSHHPPISAFYCENYNKRISLDGYIWTKSKFLGLSIGVHMIGECVLSVIDYDEDYTLSFPSAYGRSILTVPWVELGGKININCAKTGFSALVEFHTKPFYGSKKHKVTAQIFEPNEKKPFVNIEGEWNDVMYAKWASGKNESFVDTKSLPIIKKIVRPREQQEELESRKLWSNVTFYLKEKRVDEATDEKHKLEQRQRDEAKERKDLGKKWETQYFHEVGEHWVYRNPLIRRLKSKPTQTSQAKSAR